MIMCLNGFSFLFFNRFKLTVSNILSMALFLPLPYFCLTWFGYSNKAASTLCDLRVLEGEVQDDGG